ncbi:hypothetical protein [Rhizorhapis suberifaciens]|uniref:Uncharacterized protein n=1 Tax=Rhizorhapis suberifaciens TaxID=13656 RepID=A0A840HY81_9SPHN|nr:hypothetical protein [Rhizorhapis suberifaciens]MBB4642344.1 hypothetical protein [Rhizorhapis suberifaciens]
MTQRSNIVVPKRQKPDEQQFHALMVAGLARTAAKVGRGTLADSMGRTVRALDKVFAGSCPEPKALFDLLVDEPQALDELYARYGFKLAPLTADAANDFHTAADLARAAGAFMDALSDGQRDHLETLALGALFRDLLPRIQAVVSDADRIRSGVAA